MKMKTSSFLAIFFLFLSFLSPSLSERCNPKDKQVLLQIKKDLGNPYHLASWDPNTDCCQWYVVTCDPNTNRINALTVFQANISSQIPASVGDLTYLETLQFHHITNLTGTIQPAIANLTHLTMLRLSYTNLTGPVPEFLGKLKNLTLIELNNNQLSGAIPPSLTQLSNLNSFTVRHNRLCGQIPQGGKLQSFDASSYLYNKCLCGSPLPKCK